MRRIYYLLGLLVLLEARVSGYAHAPGTYPDEETKEGGDLEVPKNPYQTGWTGYEYYYEKEPKKTPPGSGKMPAFQSIESVSSDKESPEDPEFYGASGSEHGPKAPKQTTTTTTPTTTTAPTTTRAAEPEIEVVPSSTTGTTPAITTTTTVRSTTTTASTTTISTTTIEAETLTPLPSGGADFLAPDNSALYPGVEEKDDTKPETPKNLLTVLIEKDVRASPSPPPPSTVAPQSPDSSYDSVADPVGYDHPTSRSPAPSTVDPTLNAGDSYDDLGGPSGYENVSPSAPKRGGTSVTTTTATTTLPVEPYDSVTISHNSPGYLPTVQVNTTIGQPSKVEYSIVPDYGQTSTTSPVEPYDSVSMSHNAPGYMSTVQVKTTTVAPWKVEYPGVPDYGQTSGAGPVPDAKGTTSEPSESEYTPAPPTLGTQTSTPTELAEEPRNPYSESISNSSGEAPPAVPASGSVYVPIEDRFEIKPQTPVGHPPDGLTDNKFEDEDEFTPSSEPEFNPYPPPKIPAVYRETASDPLQQSETGSYDETSSGYSKPRSHTGTVHSSKFAPGYSPEEPSAPPTSNSNNAISARDPYDHFGTVPHHNQAPSTHYQPPPPTLAPPTHFSHLNGDFEDELDSGYDLNGVIVPDRSHSTTNTISGSYTDVKAQISEIDRIAEAFENSAREPVEYDPKITSESSKGITVEAGKDILKHYGRKARKCCSCCDEKQPVSRQIESKIEPTSAQQMVDAGRSLGEEPVQNFVPLENSVGGSAYVQQPYARQPQPSAVPQQTHYQQPFQQYQPQYPQSYPYQQPSGCGCQPQPQNCCAPPAPCCLPTIPCCPPIPCCPQPKICCQPQPVCLPPPTCCQLNFQLPTIPICGRACPSCPCRRRVHKALRMKRHAISANCNRCSAAGEPWKSLIHHREKRAAPGCSSGFSTMQQSSCSTCGASNLRSPRVKRMGCLPCLGRKKRDTSENSHLRVKRMGCLPCLGRKKRSALSANCSQCNSLGHLFNRYKRSLFGCSPCAAPQPCGCQGRKKRSVTMKVIKRAPLKVEQCDATCCDYSKCQNRQKKQTLVPFM